MLGVMCAYIPIVLLLFCAKELLILEHLDNTVNFHVMHVQLRTYEAQVWFRRSLSWRARPPTWSPISRAPSAVLNGTQASMFILALLKVLSHICEREPNTDESRWHWPTARWLQRSRESVRGMMEINMATLAEGAVWWVLTIVINGWSRSNICSVHEPQACTLQANC